MKKALVTGVAGFAGSHLAETLLAKKIAVFGFYHPGHSRQNISHLKDQINLIACDILQKAKVETAIAKISPDCVFHLAAFSSPAQSFADTQNVLQNNIFGELNLLEALVKIKSKAKIVIIGSADEYGSVAQKDLPIKENTPLSPLSPYAVSKVVQDMLGLQFFLHHKLQIVRLRPFNHIGPRQSPGFVIGAFAHQIALLEKNGGGEIKVGNLESYRDFTDVRDMVQAYILAVQKGRDGEVYNVGSGRAVKIADVLKTLLSMSTVKIKVKQDKSLFRYGDIKIIYCDFSKFKAQTGWQPKIPLFKTLSDTIEYERLRVSRESRVPRVPRALNQKSS